MSVKELAVSIAIVSTLNASDLSSLDVTVTGLKNSNGMVIVSLYRPHDTFLSLDQSYQTKIVSANDDCVVPFDSLKSGEYAVSVIHDENSDGKLQQWFWVGPPKEGVGASGLSDGIPTFKSSKFYVDDSSMSIVVPVTYLGKN